MENGIKLLYLGDIGDQKVFVWYLAKDRGHGMTVALSGVVGPMANGDCTGSSGQIQEELSAITSFAKGWDKGKVKQLQMLWNACYSTTVTYCLTLNSSVPLSSGGIEIQIRFKWRRFYELEKRLELMGTFKTPYDCCNLYKALQGMPSFALGPFAEEKCSLGQYDGIPQYTSTLMLKVLTQLKGVPVERFRPCGWFFIRRDANLMPIDALTFLLSAQESEEECPWPMTEEHSLYDLRSKA